MCPQSVELHNYVGEVNGKATYAVYLLHNVRNVAYRGVSFSMQGRGEADTAKLYIFDDILFATDEKGKEAQYMPHEEWKKLSDKSGYWTLSPEGKDFYYSDAGKFKVTGFKRCAVGSRRMVHFEVNGE